MTLDPEALSPNVGEYFHRLGDATLGMAFRLG
jgi:hypothetical protein